jgi:ribonuclease P protein component
MVGFTFNKNERLTKRPQFEQVLASGKKRRIDRICTVFSLPNGLEDGRLGIIASKKIGNAVKRNLAKRKIREVFRKIKSEIHPSVDVVIISGKDLVSLPIAILEKKISKALLTLS